MRVLIKKWGNNATVRIPATVMAAAAISVDQAVDVREESGRIIIEPIRAPRHDLNELLARMKSETFPEVVDFGARVGDEMW